MEVKRFTIALIRLDPTLGSEIKKTRPCLIISPDEMNDHLNTFIVAPMTTTTRAYPSRVSCTFKGTSGQIVLDQIRTIDRKRIVKLLGMIDRKAQDKTLQALSAIFSR